MRLDQQWLEQPLVGFDLSLQFFVIFRTEAGLPPIPQPDSWCAVPG